MSFEKKPKILVIVGPTASGKTSLSVQLAKQCNGEIISADSRQIYKTLNIGTGKITKEEMDGIPHHLIDIIHPEETYTADNFTKDAQTCITDMHNRGVLPIIAGGTFFYVDTLLGKINTPNVPPNPQLRSKLEALSTDELYKTLSACDPRRAAEMDPRNARRLVRAIEIVAHLGHVPQTSVHTPYQALSIGIKREKEELRARFKARAQQWLAIGFMDEIKTILDARISQQRLQEIGFEYTLGIALYNNQITEEEFLQKFVEKNWQYAKKQLMWLKKDTSIHWYTPNNLHSVIDVVHEFVSK